MLAKFGFPNSRQGWTEDNRLPSHPSSVVLQENRLLLPQKRGNSQSIQEVAVPFISSDSEPSTQTQTHLSKFIVLNLHFNIPNEQIY